MMLSFITTIIYNITDAFLLLDGFMVITTLLFNNYSMLYGNSVVAGLGISQRVIQIIDFVGMGFSMGAVPLIAYSYSYSAKNQERLRQIIKTTLLYMMGITLGLSVIFQTYVETGTNVWYNVYNI